MRSGDLLGRLGGEEFAAVLHNAAMDKAAALAERMRCAFAQAAREVDGRPVTATVSIGMVVNDTCALDLPELLGQADHALYHAKERGRNRVEVATLDLALHRGDVAMDQATTLVARTAA